MNLYSQAGIDVEASVLVCDLRSDTVTRPCEGMRKAMAEAIVGDDVYGEDPTVNKLEQVFADMLGKEAGLFLPTGTQSNLCAILAHCGRGEEVIVGDQYHVFIDEAAGASVLGGVALFPVKLEKGGSVSPETIRRAIKDDDPHCPVSRLLSLENTVHGEAIPLDKMTVASKAARDAGLSVHLDGARFFNATTALKCEPGELAGVADTVSVCLSKGLGTPAGSVLVGPQYLIAKARRNRKILGGGMRQIGVLGAAAFYALEHNLPRLRDDHDRAAKLAAELRALDCGEVTSDTNMVFLTPNVEDPSDLHAHLASHGIQIGGQWPTIRMVTHRDVNDIALDTVIAGFKSYFV